MSRGADRGGSVQAGATWMQQQVPPGAGGCSGSIARREQLRLQRGAAGCGRARAGAAGCSQVQPGAAGRGGSVQASAAWVQQGAARCSRMQPVS